MKAAQPLAQMEHGLALAENQGVDRYSGFRGDVFEFAAFDFMRDEGFALLGREFFQSVVKFFE